MACLTHKAVHLSCCESRIVEKDLKTTYRLPHKIRWWFRDPVKIPGVNL